MTVHVIYTFDDGQKQAEYPVVNEIFASPETYMRFVIGMLTLEQRLSLVKISTCVYYAAGFQEPAWYIQCNGKFYFNGEDKHLMVKVLDEPPYQPAPAEDNLLMRLEPLNPPQGYHDAMKLIIDMGWLMSIAADTKDGLSEFGKEEVKKLLIRSKELTLGYRTPGADTVNIVIKQN